MLANRTSRLARAAATVSFAVIVLAVGQLAVTVPFASASARVGWIRLAHFSPNTPAVDVYLYSFGNPTAEVVLKHVSYGDVSGYEQVAAGDYTVAMRLAGAKPSSKPVLSTAVDVAAGHSYTVAGMGPASGLRLVVIPDRLTTPPGKALVRVIQASLQQDTVTVTAGKDALATHLRFGSVTSFQTVSPGTWVVKVKGSSETATASISLAAGSIHTLVVLDEPGKLAIDDLLDASGSKVAPAGAVQTGLGGTAPHPGAPLLPWAAAGLVGLAGALTGVIRLGRRRRPALHAR
ncbi:MAG: DUF4397 domain-containing protein [Streptosporangiaceae bacterium]